MNVQTAAYLALGRVGSLMPTLASVHKEGHAIEAQQAIRHLREAADMLEAAIAKPERRTAA